MIHRYVVPHKTFCRIVGTLLFFFSSRRRHTRFDCDWSSDVCSSDLYKLAIQTWPYVCGSSLVPTSHSLYNRLYVRERIGCSNPIEVAYYSCRKSNKIGRASCRERV